MCTRSFSPYFVAAENTPMFLLYFFTHNLRTSSIIPYWCILKVIVSGNKTILYFDWVCRFRDNIFFIVCLSVYLSIGCSAKTQPHSVCLFVELCVSILFELVNYSQPASFPSEWHGAKASSSPGQCLLLATVITEHGGSLRSSWTDNNKK